MYILTVEQEQPHGHVAGQAIGGLPGALLYGARDSRGHAGEANNLFTYERESIEETDALKEGDHLSDDKDKDFNVLCNDYG